MIFILEGEELKFAVLDYVAMQQDKEVKDLIATEIIKDNKVYFEVTNNKDHNE